MSFNFVEKVMCIGGNGTEVPTLQFYKKGFVLGGTLTPTWQDIILHGNTALTLVNAKADSLEYLKLFGGTEQLPEIYLDTVTLSGGCVQRNLPSGFTQVESLANTSGAYITTSISLDDNDEIEFWWNAETSGSRFAFSQGTSADNKAFQLANADATGIVFDIQNYNLYRINTNVQAYNNGVKHIVIKNREIFIDGVSYGTSQGSVTNPTDVLRLFISSADTVSLGKFTNRFTVKNKINLIPCRRNSDSVLGMYDTVTNTFLTNAGTGDFIAGADVTAPTPDNPMDIVCNNGTIKVSPNLFDENQEFVSGYINDNGNLTNLSSLKTTAGYIKVSPNTTYTISYFANKTSVSNMNVSLWTDNNTFINREARQQINEIGAHSTSFTTTATTAKLRVTIWSDDTVYKDFQLEEGSIATPYHPYGQIYIQGTQEVVTDSLGNTANAERLLAVGDYKDTQEVIAGSVTRNVGILVLDGTENWIKSGTYTGSFYVALTSEPKLRNNSALFCTHGFKTDTLNEYSTAGIGAIYWYTSNLNYKYDDGTATVEQFQQYLADQYANGTPVIVVYPLATATTESVTGQFLSKSPVTQTAGSISNLPIAITESEKTVPTPTQPLPINCNNGVLGIDSQGNITVTGTTETVEITGKNLFNKDDNTNIGRWYSTNGTISTFASTRTAVIRCKPNTTYYFKHCTYTGGLRAFYTEVENWEVGSPCSRSSGAVTGYANTVYSITTSANAKWLFVLFGRSDITPTLEQQASDYILSTENLTSQTPYEPYFNGGTATAENLFKVGTYQDVQSVIDGGVTRNVGIKVLDGTETWADNGSSGQNNHRFTLSVDSTNDVTALCTHINRIIQNATTLQSDRPCIRFNNGGTQINWYDTDNTTTLAQFKQFLTNQYNAGTPCVILYPLATPTTETVTGQPMNIQAGTNIVQITQASMDDLELEVKYKAGVSVTITEIENAQLDDNVEVTING